MVRVRSDPEGSQIHTQPLTRNALNGSTPGVRCSGDRGGSPRPALAGPRQQRLSDLRRTLPGLPIRSSIPASSLPGHQLRPVGALLNPLKETCWRMLVQGPSRVLQPLLEGGSQSGSGMFSFPGAATRKPWTIFASSCSKGLRTRREVCCAARAKCEVKV